jgi:hypothetical protein
MSRLARVLMGVLAAGVGVIGVASSANAAAPDQQGWWTQTNPGLGSQTGLAVPSPPAPADVPSKGLLIEGGSSAASPNAYAALVYQLAAGATSLTLAVATGAANTPASTLRICPLVNPKLNAEQGGPMGDAPAFDCAHSSTAGPSADGTSYHFQVASLVAGDNLAVAILPTTATDRVVFDEPGASSLTVTSNPTPTNPAEATPDTFTGAGSATEGGTAGADLPPADAISMPSATGQSPPTTQRAVVAPPAQPVAAFESAGAGSRSVMLSILALVTAAAAAALWAAAGRARPGTDPEPLPSRNRRPPDVAV